MLRKPWKKVTKENNKRQEKHTGKNEKENNYGKEEAEETSGYEEARKLAEKYY